MASLREAVLKLAAEVPEMRQHLVPILRTAMEFDSKEEMEEYRKNHKVRPTTHMTVKKAPEGKPQHEEKGKKRAPKHEEEWSEESYAEGAPHTHKLPGGDLIRVYKSDDDAMDPYTVIMDGEDWDASANPGLKMSLGMGEGGHGVSQWGEAKEGPHLGKPVKWEDLDKESQEHIIKRVEKAGENESGKKASLYESTLKLAHDVPEMRKHLVPILREAKEGE